MNQDTLLLVPLTTPALQLKNRIVMAPMSRRRSDNGVPRASVPVYYAQRAGAGLIIAENSAVSPNGNGYLNVPGIYNDVQTAAWKQVADAVHARGGTIFLQLVHAGRIGHPDALDGGGPLVAPSAVRAQGSVLTRNGSHAPMPEPEELTLLGIQTAIDEHVRAAQNAIAAGFDGVEIHGAHGFLPEQFLHPHTNRRTDHYGGSIPNRARFLLEIMEGVVAAIGAERTGIRLSPFATINDLPAYEEERETHLYVADALQRLGILYIHLSDQSSNGHPPIPEDYIRELRDHFRQLLILAGGFTAETAERALQSGLADLVAFGRPFIANPDFVERIRSNAPLATGDQATFYQGGDQGYVDYPEFKSNYISV